MNANLLLNRIQNLSSRQLAQSFLPMPINELLYIGKESPKMCSHHLPSPVSIRSFSIEHLSGVDQIDKKLKPNRLAYAVLYSGEIVHESWVFFDALLPLQYGFDSRFPVVGDCFTKPLYRGKSIYPFALNYILNDLRNRNISSNAYILVSPLNKASIRGIENAGYQLLAQLKGTRFLGVFIFNKSTVRFAMPL